MKTRLARWPLSLVATLLLAGCGQAPRSPAGGDWLAAWGSAQLEQPPAAGAVPLRDVSLRQIVRTTVAGPALRVRLSNLFGREPLVLDTASVGLVQPGTEGGKPLLQGGSLRPLSFEGRRSVTVAPGAEVWSDPVALPVPRVADVAVQMHVVSAPTLATGHPGSRISSWSLPGNRVDATDWTDAVAKDGNVTSYVALREPNGKLRLRKQDPVGAKLNDVVLENVGAQIALVDLDLDGVPELASTTEHDADTLVVSTLGKNGVTARFRFPARDGVRALAACPPEQRGAPALVAVTPSEVWLVR